MEEAVRLAKLEYVPDFALSAGTDLAGTAQSIAGMVTAPFFRFEAIEAGIAEAEARLRGIEAMRRQAESDALAELVATLRALRDAERQAALFEGVIVPRAEQAVAAVRGSYAAGRLPLLDLLDGQRTLNDARLTLARVRAEREKLLAAAEAIAGAELGGRP
jgi:outer membrane protein TolC